MTTKEKYAYILKMSTLDHQKILVILGPTSSGKSALAIDVAREWNGEIISADSRQVYRGMDIGSGKVPRDNVQRGTRYDVRSAGEQYRSPTVIRDSKFVTREPYLSEGIPHHLLDVADPNDDYNISHFLRDACAALGDIASRGKLPIVCGGTGFWIQALVEHQNIPDIPPNPALRAELSEKTPEELFERLQLLDPARAETIDQKNPRRLIRAIEIAENGNQESGIKNQARNQEEKNLNPKSEQPFDRKTIQPYILALCPPKDILDARIRARLDARFDQGMIAEVEHLHKSGVSWERLDAFGLEYRWISRFLRGMVGEAEMKKRLFFDSVHYAKRQMTWIRRWQKLGAPLTVVETREEAFQKISTHMKEKCAV